MATDHRTIEQEVCHGCGWWIGYGHAVDCPEPIAADASDKSKPIEQRSPGYCRKCGKHYETDPHVCEPLPSNPQCTHGTVPPHLSVFPSDFQCPYCQIERLTRLELNTRDCMKDMYDELTAEIERLTAELQGTKDELYSVDKAAKELGAERDRLRAERSELAQRYLSAVAQITNLRAALERVQTTYQLTHVHELARTALAGGSGHPSGESAGGQRHPDETTDDRTPFEKANRIGRCQHCGMKWGDCFNAVMNKGKEAKCCPVCNHAQPENGDECRG